MNRNIPFHPILMHFAARHAGYTYREFASDHRALVDSNLRCLEDFHMDAVGLISDPFRETAAFGAVIWFPDEEVPRRKEVLVRSIDDVKALKNPDVHRSERTRDRILAGEELSRLVSSSGIPVIGWIEGPLAESCDLAGVNEVLLNLFMDPDLVRLLIDKTMVTAKDFARAQVEAGCAIIGVGDAICSQIAAEDYRSFVMDQHQELFRYIRSLGARVKLHICGNITHLLEDIRIAGPDIVDIDWMVDMETARARLGDSITLCGNLDPVSVIQDRSPAEIEEISGRLCAQQKEGGFILSGGCEITVNTPPENLRAMRLPLDGINQEMRKS